MELTIFIAVTAAAVVLQAIVLLAMFLAVRKSASRMEALSEEFRTKVLPTAETAQAMLVEIRPKIETAVANISEATTMARVQLQRLDATVTDAIDRSRLQIIRADDLLTKTLDRVEDTAELVHKSVVSPVRQLNGLVHGVAAGIGHLTSPRRRHQRGVTVPQDEMFI